MNKMEITFIVFGKSKFDFIEQGVKEYSSRLSRYCSFKTELIKSNFSKKLSIGEIKRLEYKKIEQIFNSKTIVILLDENGKTFDSISLANYIQNQIIEKSKKVTFVVGGAYGFDKQAISKADTLLSLSKLTFSHQLIRLIFLEQLYRSFTIINGEKYHNE